MACSSPIDLHCHSTASDGALSPAEVVSRAADNGVRVLALTDHDTVAGLDEAFHAARRHRIHLVPAAEFSCQWQRRELHVVGLGIDPREQGLLAGIAAAREARRHRILRMGEKLAARRMPGMAEAALESAGEGMPTRTHLAHALLAAGHVTTLQQAFDRHLGCGKPAWVAPSWPAMEEMVAAIRAAGGQAVLAHPLAYGMTGAWLRRTLEAFRDAGGVAVEVVCGNTDRQRVATATGQCLRAGLMGSLGSDFHGPSNPWIELGRLRPLPPAVVPVWRHWPAALLPASVREEIAGG